MHWDTSTFFLHGSLLVVGGILAWLMARSARRGHQPTGELTDAHFPQWYALVTRVRRGTLVPDHAGVLSVSGPVLRFVPTGGLQPLWSVDARSLEVLVLGVATNGLTRLLLRGPGVGEVWVAIADSPLRRRMWQLGAGPEFEVRTDRAADELVSALVQAGAAVNR